MQDTKERGKPQRAVIHRDEAVCPACWKRLCKVRPGSTASGIELWCKVCRIPVQLDIR
jgi:hypothetical protein